MFHLGDTELLLQKAGVKKEVAGREGDPTETGHTLLD